MKSESEGGPGGVWCLDIYYGVVRGLIHWVGGDGTNPREAFGTTNVATVGIGKWQHIAATYDGQTMTVYYNGVPDGSIDYGVAAAIKTNNGPLEIGSYQETRFAGRIDEVKIYNVALTASEILSYYNSSKPASPDAVCESLDYDGDGVVNGVDNCLTTYNPDQADLDGNGVGDACEVVPPPPDSDNDGIPDALDNCPTFANADQEDADNDGLGDACDLCPEDALNDFDGDGVCGDVDNCPSDVNPLQEDSDGDELGDACDPVAMGTEPQQPTGDVVISASTGAVFVDVTVTLKPQDLDGDGDLDDTYYVKPDPYNVVPKLFPCGSENEIEIEIAADQVLCGPPCSLPNDLVLVTAAGGPQDFTTTIELTQWFTRLAPGCYNVKAEYVNFCRDLDFDSDGSCTDQNGCYTDIWQGKKDLEVVKPLVLEPSKTADQCPNLPGSAGDTGCPYADKNVVMLHTVSLGKCLWKLNWEKEPLAGVSVRVFDRKNPAFLAVAGRSNPNSSLYGVIFEANQGRVGACTTDANGVCYAGEGLKGYYLAIIRFIDPETGSTVYVGLPKDPWDYNSSGIDVKHFQIIKVYKDGVFKEYRGGRMTVVEGSVLEVIEPESAVWDGNSSIYPFIFTSDSNWSVDVCAKVPAGYRIVGVYDTNGNLTQSSECVQAFVNGETKTMAFEVLETGSPEPSLNATLSLKSPKGKKVKKEVRASDVRKKTFKKWLSQAKAKSRR
jgi:hypothetical protein